MSNEQCGEVKDIRAFRASLRVLERELGNALESQTVCCGITIPQCHLMLELDGKGCVNQTMLAGALELDKSTLSRTVDSLVHSGYVSRTTDPENRRQQIICLSEKGKAKVEAIHSQCDAQYGALFQYIPVEKHAGILDSIQVLAEAMRNIKKAGVSNKGETNGCTCS